MINEIASIWPGNMPVLRSLRTGLAAANLQKFRKLATGIHANYHLKSDKLIIICLVCFRINSPKFPMAKLFSLTHSVSQHQTSVFFAYSNTLKFSECSRTRRASLWTLKRKIQSFIPVGQQFFTEEVEDGKQSDTTACRI